jgi:hypothetical protein
MHKYTGHTCEARRFNTHGICEIFVYFENGSCVSDYPSDYLFWLEHDQKWVEFSHPKIIPDNYNTYFAEATEEEDIKRGYFL